MKKPRFWWSDERGELVLDVPVGLNDVEMQNACKYTLGVYKQRYENLPPGDRRDTVHKGLVALQAGKVVQRVVGRNDFEIDRIIIGA